VTDPHKSIGKLVEINGDFGIIIECKYYNDLDDHFIKIRFMDSVHGSATIEVTWTSVIPFLVN